MPLWFVWFCGCEGGGRIETTALNYREIDPPAARFSAVELQRCFWWEDDEKHVWVAMERDAPWLPFVLPQHFVFQLALRLEGAPAGRARNYLVSQRELRGVARFGPAQSRFTSIAGIVALYREGERMRGSFRLDVIRQSQQLLGNWSSGARYLMLGNFEAVRAEKRGRRIMESAESVAEEERRPIPRALPAATRPTSAPVE